MSLEPMNRGQEVIHDLAYRNGLVNPKRIAYRLHRRHDYLSDICRRERVDFFAVANAILLEAEAAYYPHDVQRFAAVCGPIIDLLMGGTRWMATHVDPGLADHPSYSKLCSQVGALMEDLGCAISSIAAIEADGRVDAEDDPRGTHDARPAARRPEAACRAGVETFALGGIGAHFTGIR